MYFKCITLRQTIRNMYRVYMEKKSYQCGDELIIQSVNTPINPMGVT